MLRLERVPLDEVDWKALDGFGDRNVFQTPGWLEFVAQTQGADPVVARIERAGEPVGWFTGLTLRRYGVLIFPPTAG